MKHAFTVGRTTRYDESIRTNPMKTGRHDDYLGGWVWSTPAEAQLFLDSGRIEQVSELRDPATFSVYELELPTGWAEDVTAAPEVDGVHRLLHDARILRKVTWPKAS
jgi:hypothetical protein